MIVRLGAPNDPARERPETNVPGERARPPKRRQASAYLVAVILPVVTALVLVPVRPEHSSLVAIIMVIPVVISAALGTIGPAVLAAIVAGLAYDITQTQPYWHPAVNDADDLATTLTLAAVAVIVGVLCNQLVRARARDEDRSRELEHLVEFARVVARRGGGSDLSDEVCRHLAAILHLRQCGWHPGYHGTAGPVLLSTGEIMGYVVALNRDRAILPDNLEIPARSGTTELGRFIATPDSKAAVSIEERVTAATIVSLFAGVINEQSC